MRFIFPSNAKLCSCGAVAAKSGFCASCDTANCGSCKEDYWVKCNKSCVNCGAREQVRKDCPSCTTQPFFQKWEGRPYAREQHGGLRPLDCPRCNNTCFIFVPIYSELPMEERQQWIDDIKILRQLTKEYRQDQREQAEIIHQQQREEQARVRAIKQAEEMTRQEARRKVEREEAARIERQRQALLEEERIENENLLALCRPEIEAIKTQLHSMEATSPAEIKNRFQESGNYTNNHAFYSLINHFRLADFGGIPLFEVKLTNNYYTFELNTKYTKLPSLLKEAQDRKITIFECCFEHLKQQETDRLRVHFRNYIERQTDAQVRHLIPFNGYTHYHFLYKPENNYEPSKDHINKIHYLANEYSNKPFSENLLKPFNTIKCDDVNSIYFPPCIYLTFEEILTIRNEVWNESFFNRMFRKATSTHYDENTDKKDRELKTRLIAQLAFMQKYWEQLQLRIELPQAYQNGHPDLQREKIRLEYFRSLELHGHATVDTYDVDALSCFEVEQLTRFGLFNNQRYVAPASAPQAIFAEAGWHPRRTNDKKVSLELLQDIWQQYQTLRHNKLFKGKTSLETWNVYHAANGLFYRDSSYTDQCRYQILSDYASNPVNQHRDFYKILIRVFGNQFFPGTSHSIPIAGPRDQNARELQPSRPSVKCSNTDVPDSQTVEHTLNQKSTYF